MEDILFYIFSAGILVSAFLVVASRNPVNGAMFLIVAFVGIAALFVLLESFFLAVIQVLVYAGAVVVLFLFVIMLLDVEGSEKIRPRVLSVVAGSLAFALMVLGVLALFASGLGGPEPDLPIQTAAALSRNFGYELFTKYMLAFQLIGFLLLAAMVGVIYISKGGQSTAPQSVKKGEEVAQ